jgi:hypothetical protein
MTPWGYNITKYVKILLEKTAEKTKEVAHMYLTETNPCRGLLPLGPKYDSFEYYDNIRRSRYLISPIGDRDDCYRHYEAIGLGTVPISNVGEYYRPIFQNNMYYCEIEEMVEAIENQSVRNEYVFPNRDLISFEYYKEIVERCIERIKTYPEI